MTSLIQSTQVVVVDLSLCTLTPTLLTANIVDVRICNLDKGDIVSWLSPCFVVTVVPLVRMAGFTVVFIRWSLLTSVDRWVVSLRFILRVVVSSLALVICFVDAVMLLPPECLVVGDLVFFSTLLSKSQNFCSSTHSGVVVFNRLAWDVVGVPKMLIVDTLENNNIQY